MMLASFGEFASGHWRDAIEILILATAIHFAYLGLKGTRGLRVLAGIAAVVLGLALLSQALGLAVISWILRILSTAVLFALVVIFQPELRRMLAKLGSHRFFGNDSEDNETVELLVQSAFDISNRHLGALVAIERGTDIQSHIESGVAIDSVLSPELIATIFHPKTPLHDGGLIVREDRIVSAGCIFPVSQRQDIDRNLGLRHRAAIGLTEESDAAVIVVSEETGTVSLCHAGKVERNFTPESLRIRLSELLLMPKDENVVHKQPGGESRITGPGHPALGGHQKGPVERTDDIAA